LLLVTGYLLLVTCYWLLATGYLLLVTCYSLLVTGRSLVAGCGTSQEGEKLRR
jgi:hypothetical protein